MASPPICGFAIRLLKRQPLMSLVASCRSTAGLGLNILLLTLADAALVRPLPLRDPGRLVLLLLQRESRLMHNFSYPDYRDLRDKARASMVSSPTARSRRRWPGPKARRPSRARSCPAISSLALGVPLRAGRALSDADDMAARTAAVVVSEPLWRDRFGAAALSGQTIMLNGQPYTVVGVAAASFSGMQVGRRARFWVPLAQSPRLAGERSSRSPHDVVADASSDVFATARPPSPRGRSSMPSCAACANRVAGRWSQSCCSPARAATRCSPGSSPRRWRCCWPPARWCCSWRASTSPIFSWRGPRRVGASSRFARRSARAEPSSCGSCSSTAA